MNHALKRSHQRDRPPTIESLVRSTAVQLSLFGVVYSYSICALGRLTMCLLQYTDHIQPKLVNEVTPGTRGSEVGC